MKRAGLFTAAVLALLMASIPVRAQAVPEARIKAILAMTPQQMAESDVRTLRDAGWSDEDVMDIAEVAAMFNFTNRLASGLGWVPNDEFVTLGFDEDA